MSYIPIYRARRIDSDEYVEGYYVESINYKSNIQVNNSYFQEIDPTTLAIHFPDMLDSQGNKIFASLSEDGKGGDIAKYNNKGTWILIYIQNAFMWVNIRDVQKTNSKEPVSFLRLKPNGKIKIIGIQQ